MARIVRKQRPPERLSWQKAKPFLRIDFDRRCAYCQVPEAVFGPPGNFHIDHFRPKSRSEFFHLLHDYNNLYYVCADCNRYKSDTWPQPQLQTLGFAFVDPCEEDPMAHWHLAKDGVLHPTSRAGEYTVQRIHLNRHYLREWRLDQHRYQALRDRTAHAISTLTADGNTAATLRECLVELDRKLSEYGSYC